MGTRATAIVVNMVFDDTEDREVDGHNNQGEDPSDGCNKGAEQRAYDPSTAAEEESYEGEGTCDGVEHHGSSEAVDRLLGGFAEVGIWPGLVCGRQYC